VVSVRNGEKISFGVGHPRVSLKLETKMNLISRFVRDESGATAIEYGLIAALIAVAIIGAVRLVGSNLATTFASISGNLK
jgi:pilus assembly protein Flp/PilA